MGGPFQGASRAASDAAHWHGADCRVGKKGVKLYTVILARADQAGVSATFTPDLADEHHEVGWLELSAAVALPAAQLQPHLAEVLSPAHRAELAAAFGIAL